MNEARFKTLAQAYGADLDRWPAAERTDAQAYLDSHPTADDWLAAELSLDSLLSAAPPPPVSGLLRERIIASAPRPERVVWRRGGAWMSGAGLAAACVLGLLAGANLPSPYFDDPAVETAAETATVFDGTGYFDALEIAG